MFRTSVQGLQDIIAILGMEDLSEDDKLTVYRTRKIQDAYQRPFDSGFGRNNIKLSFFLNDVDIKYYELIS